MGIKKTFNPEYDCKIFVLVSELGFSVLEENRLKCLCDDVQLYVERLPHIHVIIIVNLGPVVNFTIIQSFKFMYTIHTHKGINIMY